MFLHWFNGWVVVGVLTVTAFLGFSAELTVADYIPPAGGEPPRGITGTTGVVQV